MHNRTFFGTPLWSITLAAIESARATVLQGAVHLVLFAVFLFLAIVP